jgi:hypothetical protein
LTIINLVFLLFFFNFWLYPAGPVAALASAGWLWSVLHPSSHNLASCLVALAAVAADYGSLSRDISRRRVQPGAQHQHVQSVMSCAQQ